MSYGKIGNTTVFTKKRQNKSNSIDFTSKNLNVKRSKSKKIGLDDANCSSSSSLFLSNSLCAWQTQQQTDITALKSQTETNKHQFSCAELSSQNYTLERTSKTGKANGLYSQNCMKENIWRHPHSKINSGNRKSTKANNFRINTAKINQEKWFIENTTIDDSSFGSNLLASPFLDKEDLCKKKFCTENSFLEYETCSKQLFSNNYTKNCFPQKSFLSQNLTNNCENQNNSEEEIMPSVNADSSFYGNEDREQFENVLDNRNSLFSNNHLENFQRLPLKDMNTNLKCEDFERAAAFGSYSSNKNLSVFNHSENVNLMKDSKSGLQEWGSKFNSTMLASNHGSNKCINDIFVSSSNLLCEGQNHVSFRNSASEAEDAYLEKLLYEGYMKRKNRNNSTFINNDENIIKGCSLMNNSQHSQLSDPFIQFTDFLQGRGPECDNEEYFHNQDIMCEQENLGYFDGEASRYFFDKNHGKNVDLKKTSSYMSERCHLSANAIDLSKKTDLLPKPALNETTDFCDEPYDRRETDYSRKETEDSNITDLNEVYIDPIIHCINYKKRKDKYFLHEIFNSYNDDSFIFIDNCMASDICFYKVGFMKNTHRMILIEWIFDFIYFYKLKIECAFSAIYMMDMICYIDNSIDPNNYQLIAATSIFIASKMIEINPISSKEVVSALCDGDKHDDLLKFETLIVLADSIDLNSPTLFTFLEIYVELLIREHEDFNFSQFLLTVAEMCIANSHILSTYKLSEIGLAICFFTFEKFSISFDTWAVKIPNLCMKNVKECKINILKLVKNNQEFSGESIQARIQKYITMNNQILCT